MEQRRSHARALAVSILVLAASCAWPAQARPGQAGQEGQAQARQSAAREQGAAAQRQTRKTDQANRAAAVEDETSAAAQAARTAQSETAQFEAAQGGRAGTGSGAPSYGPVLAPRGQQAQDPARKDPAEVHDETDSLTRQAPAQPAEPSASQRRKPNANPNLRRPAWQPAAEPMAPRPLRSAESLGPAADPTPAEPIPAPAQPRPGAAGPTTGIIAGCQGNSCTDTSGRRYNGIGTGKAGVGSNGRLCTRNGVSVQCF